MSPRARHQRRWGFVSIVCSLTGMGLFLATGFAHDFGDYSKTAVLAALTFAMFAGSLLAMIHATDI